MADPISVTSLVLAIGGVVQALLKYSTAAKEARNDIQTISVELFALKGILEHVEYQQQVEFIASGSPPPGKFDSDEFLQILRSASQFLQSLQISLEPSQSRFGRSIQSLKWPFKKEDVQKHIAKLERIKSWFILVMTSDHLSYNREIWSGVSQLSESLRDEQKYREQHKTDREKQELLQWLAPVEPQPILTKACLAHHPGTGAWFLQGPLVQFMDGPPDAGKILWLKGKSGSGKTTLISHTIKYMKTSISLAEAVGIAYFYCSFDDLASQDPLNILGSLVAQISPQVPAILEYLAPKFRVAVETNQPREFVLQDLETSFAQHTAALSRVFLLVDAVNESEKSTEIVELLFRVAEQCKNARVLITSTWDLGRKMVKTPQKILEIEMCARDIREDICLYIDSTLREDSNLGGYSEELKQNIREAVLGRAAGMFRYARWQLEHLAAQRTGRGVKKALSDMPQDLNETYARLLMRLSTSSPDRNLLRRTLLWLSFATRPLSLLELADAVVLEESDTGIDNDSRLCVPEILIDISHGLVDYERESMNVALTHSSIKTFLTSDWTQQSPVADFMLKSENVHKDMMRICLTHLCFSEFKDGCGQSAFVCDERLTRYPLLAYAAKNWVFHAKDIDEEDWRRIRPFLATSALAKGGNFGWWLQLITGNISPHVVEQTNPLYYAASFGYNSLVAAILEFNPQVELEAPGGNQGSTALQVACFRKRRQVSRLLVEAGADAFSKDGSPVEGGFSAYWWAKTNGWEDIMELMERKASKRLVREHVYRPGSVAFALTVQETVVQEMHNPQNESDEI